MIFYKNFLVTFRAFFQLTFLIYSTQIPASPFQNGSFEINRSNSEDTLLYKGDHTTIPGWRITKGNIDLDGAFFAAADGKYSLDLDGNGAHGEISQKFETIPGKRYQVSFALSGNSGDSLPYSPQKRPIKKLRVSAASTSRIYTFDVTGYTWSNPGWITRKFTFTAKHALTTLSFKAFGTADPCLCVGPAIDNVKIKDYK